MDSFNFDFNLLNIDGNLKTSLGENLRLTRPMEQCQLCNKLRKTFYCKNCIKNGDFFHSTSRERFADKRSSLLRIQSKKDEINKGFEQYLMKVRLKENLAEEVRIKREKIAMLKELLVETEKKAEMRQRKLEKLKEINNRNKEDLLKNEDCHLDLNERTMKFNDKRLLNLNKLNIIKPHVKELIRKRIKELVQFIFPINEVQSTKSTMQITDSQEDIKKKLAEATRTVQIRDQWVITNSWGETQHSIVAPTLPDSGDYASYLHYVSSDNGNTMAMTSSSDVDHNPAYNLTAALTYTTQLVNIIAYYLDIRLPNKLFYSEFCEKNLNERRFMKCVTHLNANILFLCLTQNVDSRLLHPSQTIRNLLLLLDTRHSDLGRQDIVDIDTSCVSYYEEQLSQKIRTATARLSFSDAEEDNRDISRLEARDDDDDEENDSDHLSADWEAVPLVSCPEAQPGSNASRRPTINSSQSSSSTAGGIMSSFYTILRGFSGTNKPQNN